MNDRTLASPDVFGALARATYRAGVPPQGYRETAVSDPKLAADLKSADAKMFANADGHRVVSFAGTQSFPDAVTDVAQGLGFPTLKYAAAARIGAALKGADVDYTGHSLGGGLARLAGESASAGSTPKTVVTFNPAGVHAKTFAAFGLDPRRLASRQIDISHGTDLLQSVNALQGMPRPGTSATVGEPGVKAVDRIFAREDGRTMHDPETDGALKAMQAVGAGLTAHRMTSVAAHLPDLDWKRAASGGLGPNDLGVIRAARRESAPDRGHELPGHGR